MSIGALEPQPLPLTRGEDGEIYVGDSPIPLERVVESFRDGTSPETIVQWFDMLKLADVYAVLSYCMNHADEVAAYMAERDAVADAVRAKIAATQTPRPNFRNELIARRARLGPQVGLSFQRSPTYE